MYSIHCATPQHGGLLIRDTSVYRLICGVAIFIPAQLYPVVNSGERTKGYGRLEGGQIAPFSDARYPSDGDCKLVIQAGAPFPFLIEQEGVPAIRGQAEPIIGRTTKDRDKHGSYLESARICWLPGTVSDGDVTVQLSDTFPGTGTQLRSVEDTESYQSLRNCT